MRGNQPTNHVHGMWRNFIGGDVWLIKYFEYLQLGNWNAYCFHSIIVDVSGTKTGLVVYGWAFGPTDPGTDWADVGQQSLLFSAAFRTFRGPYLHCSPETQQLDKSSIILLFGQQTEPPRLLSKPRNSHINRRKIRK